MVLCARCFGVYLGLLIGGIIPFIITFIYQINVNLLLLLMIIGIAPMALDGFTQYIGIRKSNNYLRFSSGFLAGFFLGLMFNWLLVHVLILDPAG